MATKRQKVIFEFARLSQFLEEQQSVLLAELEKLDGDILKQRDVFDALVSEETCRFSTLVAELEEKLGRPARELLTVSPACLARPSSTVTGPNCPLHARVPAPWAVPQPRCPWALAVCPTIHKTGRTPSLPTSRGLGRVQRKNTVQSSTLKTLPAISKACYSASRATSGRHFSRCMSSPSLEGRYEGPSEAWEWRRDMGWGGAHSWFTGRRCGGTRKGCALASSKCASHSLHGP